jgi:hypothetical protein
MDALIGKPAPKETTQARPVDSAKLGVYVKLGAPLPADFVSGLLKLDEKALSKPYKTDAGQLVVRITKKDTAQKAGFDAIAKKFSSAPSRWSGGDLYWLAADDKAHDAKLVKAAFALSKNGISPIIKLNDSTYTFVKMEEKKDAYTRPFSEVKSKIENKLRRQEEKALYDQLLKDLRAGAKLELLMKESDFVSEPAPAEEVPAGTATPEPGK